MLPNVFSSIRHYGAIEISGKDASHFLQGQLTNDITTVTSTAGQFAAYCNQQGRVIALCAVIAIADATVKKFILFLPQGLLPSVLTRLRRYVVAAKVNLVDVSEQYCLFAGSHDSAFLNENPDIFRVDLLPNKKLFFYGARRASDQTDSVLQELSKKHLDCIDNAAWNVVRMQHNLVEINSSNSEKFLPHYLNLVNHQMVNFNKGCYVGQEIIARMQFRGTIKKHLVFAEFSTTASPQIEDTIDEIGVLVEYHEITPGFYAGLFLQSD